MVHLVQILSHFMKRIILAFLTLLPLVGFCQSNSFTINGKLTNIKSPVKVYLLNLENESVDSVISTDGSYSFTGKVKIPADANLILDKNNKGYKSSGDRVKLYLEPGTITVDSHKDLMRFSIISGTENNDAEQTLKGLSKVLAPINKLISDKNKAASPEQKESDSFIKEMGSLESEIITVLTKEYINFVRTHPNSLASIGAILDISDFQEYQQIDALFQSLTQNVKENWKGKILAEKLTSLKNTRLNALAPDLTSTDTLGNTVKLSSLRGKYVLIDVWASWCGPCRKENPNQVRTYNKFKDKNFAVLGVSLDDDRKSWVNAIRKDGLPWTNVSDLKGWKGQIVELYGLNSLPQNYLLDPNGVIIAKNLQGIALSNKLSEIFGEK